MSRRPAGVALIGYGLAGEVFHAPLIGATKGLALRAVVSSRAALVAGAGLTPVGDVGEVLADPAIALVVIATPNATHHGLARAALLAGKHVVVDKPLGLTSAEASDLIALAASRGLVLTPFHNRRWDGDFLTVRRLIADGHLGEVMFYEACWDRHRPGVASHWKEDAEGGGLLNDLGPHLVDQVLLLFGAPERVSAELRRQRPGGRVDDYFDLRLFYGERVVRLGASMLVAAPRPRFQLHGTLGSYVKSGLDPQQGHLKSGLRPGEAGYGRTPGKEAGWLTAADGTRARIPTERGRWSEFYRQVAAAIRKGGPVPVAPEDGLTGLRVMETARLSAQEGRSVELARQATKTA